MLTDACALRGLELDGLGLWIVGNGNVVEGCNIHGAGQGITHYGAENRIGGPTPAQRNLIRKNLAAGIYLAGSAK